MVYDLAAVRVLGPYVGRLANGGEQVRLLANGGTVDSVRYDDAFPWPIGADALGAGSQWLPEDWLPVEAHALRGRSLRRLSYGGDSDDPANWVASPLDAADPGSVATLSHDPLPPVAVELRWNHGVPGPLAPNVPIHVRVRLSGEPPPALAMEYFADDVQAEGEPIASVPLVRGDGVWTAHLPAQPEETILRVRLTTEDSPLYPRLTDPMRWAAVFVATPLEGETRPYRLYIDTARWTSLWDAVSAGRVQGCVPNPTWDDRVPAVFVHEGRVFDVQVRYQGSRWNRARGRRMAAWEAPGPERPNPMMSLSWSIRFPRYARLDGHRTLVLNKLIQACPGLNAMVGFDLFRAAGLPSPLTRFVRLFVNGAYYSYTIELERPDAEMFERWLAEDAEHRGGPPEPGVPHVFKSTGCNCDEGPFGWGDGRTLGDHCGYPAAERYAHTYERKTWRWGDNAELQWLIEAHAQARQGTDEELAAFLAEHFDVDRMLTYLAVINWAVPFDDMFHNHYWVQRLSDGRWFMTAWDLDLDFGGLDGPDSSIFIGAQGDPNNRNGWWHRVKDSFFRIYARDYADRLFELNETILHPDAVLPRVDAAEAAWSLAEVAAAPAGAACDFTGKAEQFRAFARARYEAVSVFAAPPD